MTQNEALDILKTGANVFLTGEPGSGKTHTINTFILWLRSHNIEPSITASTGIAATHIGGLTIHSWSGIGILSDLTAWDLDRIAQNERVVKRIRGCQTLIIDEISMLSATTFTMLDVVCRTVRGNQSPFGGLQVVLVGDFFQLPPIERKLPMNNGNDYNNDSQEEILFDDEEELPKSPFAFNSPVWRLLNPIVCYLSEQHRQEDGEFLTILSAIRNGEVTDSHREVLLAKRVQKKGADVTNLYSHNADVDRINDVALGKISEEGRLYTMTSQGSAALVAGLKRGCLSPESLALKVGARVMFTKNDPEYKYVNGTTGVVTGFVKGSDYPIVRTNSGRVVVVEPVEWSVSDGGRILARINQVPLRLAWAITVHKSQGMSLDSAHMDLSSAFEYGQGYVAISRVRTLAGLSLAGLNTRALEVHPEIRIKDAQFREASEVAQESFAKMSPADLTALHNNFIRACGGTVTAQPKKEVSTTSKLDEIRENHPNAYRPWTKEDDMSLKVLFEDGKTQAVIAKHFGRKPGAIHMRLVKLGLIEAD